MKTINLSLSVMLLLFAFNVHAKEKIVIKKLGGGPKGYKNVKELHSGGTHKLECSDPGFAQCNWMEGFSVVTSSQLLAIEKIVDERIGEKDYSGKGNLAGTKLWFCWVYDASTGTTTYSVTEDAPDCNFE
jgi:hypothetical protein